MDEDDLLFSSVSLITYANHVDTCICYKHEITQSKRYMLDRR